MCSVIQIFHQTEKKILKKNFHGSYYQKKNLCDWHNLKEEKIQKLRKIKLTISEEKTFFKNLYKIGYRNFKKLNFNKKNRQLIQAFQRRFRQELINGKIDKECFLISKALIK